MTMTLEKTRPVPFRLTRFAATPVTRAVDDRIASLKAGHRGLVGALVVALPPDAGEISDKGESTAAR